MNDPTIQVLHGDNRQVMAGMPDASIDAIVTDPPYELGFMGKKWDASGIAYQVDLWRECLRVLKPGGHLLAFGGTRTYHRMAVAIEDAGFEIRDSIHWVYGSGFPKSLDVSKAIDKSDAAREQQARRYRFTEWVRSTGLTAKEIDEATGTFMGHHYTTHSTQPAIMTVEHLDAVRHLIGEVPKWVEAECRKRSVESKNFAAREVVGTRRDGATRIYDAGEGQRLTSEIPITAPTTDEARRWEGWGTALKPAHEPIVLARKPLEGTVAANVLQHSTGGLNIDECRVPTDDNLNGGTYSDGAAATTQTQVPPNGIGKEFVQPSGRWPANIVFDKTAGQALDQQTQHLHNAGSRSTRDNRSPFRSGTGDLHAYPVYNDSGGASRFFTQADYGPNDWPFIYQAKPSKKERNAGLNNLPQKDVHRYGAGIGEGKYPHAPSQDSNHHPTVKPIDLMKHLIRLVTPPNGTILDPFAGSGTTLIAAIHENKNAIGIELQPEYIPIIQARIKHAQQTQAQQPKQTPLDFNP